MAQQTDDNKMKSTKTAVEWIFQKMTEQGTNPYWDMRFIQAKQMEKEQIMNAFQQGVYEAVLTDINYTNCDEEAEVYYNETYKNENNTQNQ